MHFAENPQAEFSKMEDGTAAEWEIIKASAYAHVDGLPDRVLTHMKLLADDFGGFAVDRLEHSLQTATRAMEDRRDEDAISIFEAYLREGEAGTPMGWVRDLVAGGRNPTNGQAHLDRRIPEIVASMPKASAYEMKQHLIRLYLRFGFLDRFFELLEELGKTTVETWNDAEVLIVGATIMRQSGFTAHPRYLEVAEKYAYGVVSLWDVRGTPDHCKKLDERWACE